MVAPQRGFLASATAAQRKQLLATHFPARVLLGEPRAWRKPVTVELLRPEARRLRARTVPRISGAAAAPELEWVLFVPELAPRVPRSIEGVRIVELDELLG